MIEFGRALRSGRRSRRFESCHLDQKGIGTAKSGAYAFFVEMALRAWSLLAMTQGRIPRSGIFAVGEYPVISTEPTRVPFCYGQDDAASPWSLLCNDTGSHTPLGDRQARLTGVECACFRASREYPVISTAPVWVPFCYGQDDADPPWLLLRNNAGAVSPRRATLACEAAASA